jgi:hypothetical protein
LSSCARSKRQRNDSGKVNDEGKKKGKDSTFWQERKGLYRKRGLVERFV